MIFTGTVKASLTVEYVLNLTFDNSVTGNAGLLPSLCEDSDCKGMGKCFLGIFTEIIRINRHRKRKKYQVALDKGE